ncbi:ATP-binding cassette domain-containing protein, partial [bacterium]|nr:ATP-binding cassette domain-containing protein [bacterium]
VQDLCGRVAVMRRGKLVGEAFAPFSTDHLVRMMFGKAVPIGDRTFYGTNQVALKLSGLCIEDSRLHIRNVNLDTYKGEVIGLAGMEGSGQRQFLRALGGLIRPVNGKIYLNGKDLTGHTYHSFMQNGISYVPAARLEEGLIGGLSLSDHFILARKQDGFFIDRETALNTTQRHIEEFNIRGTPTHRIEALSGGNQQRALLALQRSPLNLLLMEHPTRGLDIESVIWIWGKLKERCKQSTSIVFISSDLEELLQYSDRILVFFGGKVSQPLDAATTTVDQLGQLIGGMGF